MPASFEVGDLVRMKPAAQVFRVLPASASLVMVTKRLPCSPRLFYGIVCGTGESHLFSYDSFYLVSKAVDEKNF